MGHGLFLATEMTFILLYNFISEESGIGGQDVVHNFVLSVASLIIIFGHFEGITITSANCLPV